MPGHAEVRQDLDERLEVTWVLSGEEELLKWRSIDVVVDMDPSSSVGSGLEAFSSHRSFCICLLHQSSPC